jgi:hypothetical protein
MAARTSNPLSSAEKKSFKIKTSKSSRARGFFVFTTFQKQAKFASLGAATGTRPLGGMLIKNAEHQLVQTS